MEESIYKEKKEKFIRGKGKANCELGLKDMYKFYKAQMDVQGKSAVKYPVYSKVIKACNKVLIKKVVEESDSARLPLREGYLRIVKFERAYSKYKSKWAIDWKKTHESGVRVYHEQKFIYKWVWQRRNCVFKNSTKYKFVPSRFAKREVPKQLKLNRDYYSL